MLVAALAALAAPSASAAEATGQVRGEVVEAESGRPVDGATIGLPASGAVTRSRADGTFEFSMPVVTASPYSRIEAVVTAPGWGRWRISGAPLYPKDALVLHVELRRTPFTHHVMTPEERAARGQAGVSDPDGLTGNTCSGWDTQLIPPKYVRVYRHMSKKSEKRDFVFYARHVLPNEWITSWDDDALAAGAIAVRTYAAYKAMSGHAYSSGSGCADVRDDSQDQIFDPSWSAASTDQAVYESYGSILYRDGGLFLTQYFAGAEGDPCKKVTGQFAGRMSQWGTQTCATVNRKSWPNIVTTFYADTVWKYLENLLLNPGFETEPMYPWIDVADTSYDRKNGEGYAGNWYLGVTATVSGRNAIVREERLYDGKSNTEYHAEAALRCSESKDCTISMKVVTVGSSTVTKTKTVTVRSDGEWHFHTFDPAAGGKSHDEVWLSFVSVRDFDLDAAVLKGP